MKYLLVNAALFFLAWMGRLLYSVVVRRQLLRSMWVVLSSLQQGAPLPGSAVNANASFGECSMSVIAGLQGLSGEKKF